MLDFDSDGALAEAQDTAVTRSSLLARSVALGGGLLGTGALLGLLAPRASAASLSKGDVAILNYALTLEYLEAAFYNGASAANLPLSAQGAAFLKVVAKDENAHVKFLKGALGASAAKEPKFDFKGTNTNAEMFMKTAQVLENTGVHAYSGQALNIQSPKYVKAAVSILTIEARHASVIGLLNEPAGEAIAPNGPFDTPLTASQVLTAVKGTGFIVA